MGNISQMSRRVAKRLYEMTPACPRCAACGQKATLKTGAVLWPELIAEWEISPEWAERFDRREGMICSKCGSSLRSRQLAEVLVAALNKTRQTRAESLNELCGELPIQALAVAEINSAGSLHPFLQKLPHLRYSEYGSKIPGVPSEDLTRLSYADATFDLVITSETLEHVPDVDLALSEIRRILKPDGLHIFTIPIVWDRPATRQRASIQSGELTHHLPPSYHGAPKESKNDFLVFYEYGVDFVARCERAGFQVDTIQDKTNPALIVFVTQQTL